MPISSQDLAQMLTRLRGGPLRSRSNASNTGKTFESQIQESLDEYRRQGIMWGHKVDPPVRLVGKRTIFLSNPFLDFSAVYTSENGRAIHFEAKSTKTGRLPLGRAGGITYKQLVTIKALLAARAIVFVLWRVNEPKPMRTFLIPGPHILHLNENMRSSLIPSDGFTVETSVGLNPLPFEPVMRGLRYE